MKLVLIIFILCLSLTFGCGRDELRPSQPGVVNMKWDPEQTQDDLTISADGLTLSWKNEAKAAWLGSQSTARLRSGIYTWDFEIKELANRQIGVGIMLDPPDWGFFGYLGAGSNAWAYDAYEGAIVTETKAIYSGLPKVVDRGSVSVRLDLLNKHTCVFTVNGVATHAINLPRGCIVIPAACLLKQGQAVSIANLKQIE